MWKHTVTAFGVTRLSLLVVLGAAHQTMAQDVTTAYPNMAPIDQYLMPDYAG